MAILDTMKVNIGNACFEVLIRMGFYNTLSSLSPRLHCHPTYEVYCIERGTMTVTFEDTVKRITGPAIVLIPPKFYHKIEFMSQDTIKYSFEFSLSMSGNGNSFHKYSQILGKITAPEIIIIQFPTVEYVRRYEKSNEELGFMVYSHVGQILIRVFNTLSVKYPETKNITPGKKSSLHKEIIVQEIIDYMEQNAQSNLTLSDIAEKFNFSERQIERLLKDIMHESFFSLLNKYRIRMALIMISNDEDSLTKIAEKCGFSNYVTFWNHFTKLNGMTPSEYQKRHNKSKV
ncbi:MAG: helix-turn-helix domain-containing protein [Clostridia bacterium]|nr:helix-turn-helix domain-containing protein [Clostridia bacterium]